MSSKFKTQCSWKFLEPRAPLDMKALNEAVRRDATDLRPWLDQMSANQTIRDCVWPGQSPDGRVRKRFLGGKPPRPWEGASDARLPVADEVINETKLVMTSARRAAKLEVKGRNSAHDEEAALITPVLHYVLGTQMGTEASTQPELMADYALEHGVGFMHVGWRSTREIEEAEISIEDLLGLALQMQGVQAPPDGNEQPGMDQEGAGEAQAEGESMQREQMEQEMESILWEMLLNPEARGQVIELLQAYDPAMTKDEAGRVAAQLKRGESATYYRPYVRESRPFWEALCLGVDLTLPPSSMMNLQHSPRVTRWHWLSEAMLYDMALAEGWDEDVLNKVSQNPGAMWQDWAQQDVPAWVLGTMGVGTNWTHEDARQARLYHIAETWQRFPTKAGPSVLYRTVHHSCCPDKPLKHEVLREKHGCIPIVTMRAETRSKLLVQSRGIAQRCQSWQSSLKLHHDAQDNGTMLRTTPPMEVPVKRFGQDEEDELPISPFAQIQVPAVGQTASFKFTEVPGAPVDSARIQQELRSQVRRYFGLADTTVPGPVTQMHQQGMVGRFLEALNEALDLTLQLCQQYMDPIVGAKVAGMAMPLHASREDIQGEWLMDLSYDVRELDLEWLTKKFDLLAKMLQFDSGGTVKRGELMKYVFAAADPVLAQRLVVNDEGAVDAAMNDEKSVIAAQVSGQRVTGRLESPQSRLQAHEEWLQNPESLDQLHARPTLLQLEIARVEALEFQVVQTTQNRTTGRTGEKATAPWEEGQKLSDRLKAMFGIGPLAGAPAAMAAPQPEGMAA